MYILICKFVETDNLIQLNQNLKLWQIFQRIK